MIFLEKWLILVWASIGSLKRMLSLLSLWRRRCVRSIRKQNLVLMAVGALANRRELRGGLEYDLALQTC